MNSRRKFIRDLVGASAGLGLVHLPADLLAKQDLVSLSILHTNDIHCHIDPFPKDHSVYQGRGGLARLSGLINQIRKTEKNVLLFDAGDMFQGTPYFNYYKGELILKVMSEMGYDAGMIGNHEFDNGMDGIEESIGFAKFPLVCSNYDFSKTRLYDTFPTYNIYRKNGIKVGVYGLGVELDGLVGAQNYLETEYLDPVKVALEKELFLKKEKGCDLVICLSHLGLQYKEQKISDRLLAAETHYTDLIIGGHTHSFLDSPLKLKNADGNRILVNQAGWGGMVLGRIDFIFDRHKKEDKQILSQNIPVSE
ncbi:2',3'-cyclic-nucleotide 2'-phosphodiesterase [Sunxiuqinia dokdonensis]|uniref:2',3'-cyclic-nucleotide 2'-phosphodiesterase n=2 Tax=Sunxiuqinia dokdonensis TaxID=1409788 RepID=A0A0L8V5D4_9BACT|nr:2',3'-cyclic-nucleotide 2'-phosphodiesterase [Sunxiuqinia dokdonensis]